MNETINDYIVLDIETTGLSIYYDEIIEITALKVRNNAIVEEFSSLIKPVKSINYFITNLTGISNEMVMNSPSIECILPLFKEFVKDDVLLGHNLNFDIGFLNLNLKKYNLNVLDNKRIDTLFLAREKLKLNSYKLSNIALYFGIDIVGNHRSGKDCLVTYEIYKKLSMI